MNVFKIAWRSIQHRGFGSWLTIVSMALGVMMVVSVLSIHGLVARSFKANNSFGYNILVGARGGAMQLTMNSVYYLSQPVENIPYEYFLAFCDQERRETELKNSIAWRAFEHEQRLRDAMQSLATGAANLPVALAHNLIDCTYQAQRRSSMKIDRRGFYNNYVDMAIPLCLGDYFVDEESGAAYRCVGTNADFFTELVLDIETEEKFEFAQGRCFEFRSEEHGFYECVIGSIVAARSGLKLGDTIRPTHGDPSSSSSHIHDTPFTVVGILKPTETPNDRVVFMNMEGFYLMEDHAKPLSEESILKVSDDQPQARTSMELDLFADEEEEATEKSEKESDENRTESGKVEEPRSAISEESVESSSPLNQRAQRFANLEPLPIEQREVTSILVRTTRAGDEFGMLGYFLTAQINNDGDLETALDWSPFRPERSQKAAQAVSPIEQVTTLFQLFVDPIQWLLLALTCMILVVSALSILVGIYNSMSQRQHEIAVIRALGARRASVMMIMFCEAMLLALLGGALGWVAGHGLNAALNPWVESQTGVSISFFDLAPGISLELLPGVEYLPTWLAEGAISSELLIIPGLMILAIMVGIYPAISAYRTDVSRALAK